MAEYILSMIQKLEVQQQSLVDYEKGQVKIELGDGQDDFENRQVEMFTEWGGKVINELREIVDILRDKNLGDERRLHYFISDLVYMAHDAINLCQPKNTKGAYYKNMEMESIQGWIREIKMRMLKSGDDGTETESNMRISEYVGEGHDEDEDEDVVGLEEDAKLLRTYILSEERCLNFFFVSGMAGTGKTTLARQLYNHAHVISRFERRSWVCVSSELTYKEVLMKLIQQMVDSDQLQRDSLLDKMECEDHTSLQQMLRRCLQGVRYFIVLDDLPEQMNFQNILKALPIENAGSQFLVTSRTITGLFKHSPTWFYKDFVPYTHEMEPLDIDQSWRLFLKTILCGNKSTNEHEFPKKMEKMGRDMLSKYGGVPLALKQMAREFAQKRRSGSEWEQLLQPTDFHTILEALILLVIVKIESLESLHEIKELTDELRTVVDYVRDKKLVKGSRLYYMICDIVDMAQDLDDGQLMRSLPGWTREVKLRMLDTETPITLENIGVGDDEDEDVVDLEEDVELLIRKAIRDKDFSISLVTGMDGIGKKTLARQVYRHADVIHQFSRRAWVRVSSDFSHRDVLIKLIQQVVDSDILQRDSLLEKTKHPSNSNLRRMLRKHLKGMRYFIVLADVPKEMCMEYMLKAFPDEDTRSRLLVTTCTPTIHMGKFTYIHEIKPLDFDRSWRLFLKTIFCGNKSISEHELPKQIEKMGRDMLSIYGGVPLRIKQVAREFAQKRRSGSQWEQLLQPTDFHTIFEALILQAIVKIDSLESHKKPIELTGELRMVVDLVRDKNLVEGSRLYYMICDIVDIAQDLDNQQLLSSLQGWTREVKLRMLDTQTPITLENIGDEDGEDEDENVGDLEEDMKLLIRKAICNEEKGLSTSFITGMVGIGKKTLARQVYRHADIISQFDRRAWVRVSSDFSHKEVLIKLIQQIVDSDKPQRDSLLVKMKHPANSTLHRILHEHLKGMRYFIVLADVPKEMCMEYMLKAFPHEDTRSRLLVTTRTRIMHMGRDPYIHEMEPLDFDDSWQLFLKTIFCGNKSTNEDEFPKQIEKMGRDMLSKYGGVPLAIKQVARQFSQKRQSGTEWEQLLQPTDFHTILEALILLVIVKIDSLESQQKTKELTEELRMVVDLVREKKLVQGSRLYYMICDVIDIAHDLDNEQLMRSLSGWIRQVKLRMLDTQTPITLENIGDRDDEDEDVVGLEEDVELLIRIAIFNEKKGFSTSCVTGMVGIGKKTLARQVYRHADVIGQFDRRAWVRVSSDFSHKEVLIKLIQQVVDSDKLQRDSFLVKMKHTGLRRMLHKHLKGKRYCIVLADLPKEMCLQYMLKALPHEENGSRLLLTSPSQNIEVSVDYTHQMKTLDSDMSWRLFLRTVCELNFPNHLKSRGKEMLKKCDGLPLAIKYVGREFAKKRRLGTEWEQLLEPIDLGAIVDILEPSYQKLDQQLKYCFLHLAFFKENINFRKQKLEQIWAVGGILSESHYKGRSYGEELNRESMIEIVDRGIYDNPKTYRINAILHSLSRKKAHEEIDLEILRDNGNNQSSENSRHRVIICSRDKFDYSSNHGNKRLVSLFFHGGGYLEASPSYWNSFLELRILDLEDFGIKILPECIFTLIELRYLGLRNNYIQELPPSLGCLKKLEVLDIAQNFMVEVPEIIWEMGSLLHLYISDVICRRPSNIDAFKNLKTLTYITFDDWTYEISCLQMMTGVRKLGIVELDENSDISKLFVSLAKLEHLEHLILRGYRCRSMPCLDELGILGNFVTIKLDGLLRRLPSNYPQHIESLTLVNSCLDEDPMPILQKLTSLVHLKLRNAYTGQQMVILPNGFQSLEYLFIEESWNLSNVEVGEGAMQYLNHLTIKNCPNLENLPEVIGSAIVHILTTKIIAREFRKSASISKLKLVVVKP